MTSETTSKFNKMSPKTKKILGGIGGVAVLLAGAFFIYAILVTPSKQPYRDALSQYKNVYNANVAFTNAGASLNASGATEEEFKKNLENIDGAATVLRTEADGLAKKKVMAEDKGLELYKAFDTKLTAYIAYNAGILASIEQVRPLIFGCNEKMATITEDDAGAKAMQDCATQAAELNNVPDADYQTLVNSFKVNYEAMATTIAQKASGAISQSTSEGEREEIIANFNAASTQFSKDLQTSRTKVDITEAAMAIDDYLSKKSSIF